MLDFISCLTAIEGSSRMIVDIVTYFGLFIIVAMALNFQYGNAGIPNMGCAVQVIAGAFTTSAISTRLIFVIVQMAGVELLPYYSDYDWLYNNQINVSVLTNAYLKDHPLLCISLLLLSLALALIVGAAMGWVISRPAIRLKGTYLMITLITMADASQLLGKNIPFICGGTLGVFIPNLFSWYPGDRSVVIAIIILILGLISFLVFRTMVNSPYGRLMRALRENVLTAESLGKNVVKIKSNILIFASSITALAGVMNAFYFSYVVDAMYQRAYWTYWPWLMLMLGGPGNNAGTFLGCVLIVSLRRIIIVNKWAFQKLLFFPVTYIENLLLGVLLIIVMIFRPNGLIPEKLLYVPGINYNKLVSEEFKGDWRKSRKDKIDDELSRSK